MDRSLASAINYQNGKKVNLSEITENMYQPYNQSDGIRQMNDKSLIQMDKSTNQPIKRLKMKRGLNWTGGILLSVIGGVGLVMGIAKIPEKGYGIGHSDCYVPLGIGIISCAGGVILIKNAINNQKKIKKLTETTLFKQEYKLNNGTILTPSINILRDQAHNYQTIGFGLRYDF